MTHRLSSKLPLLHLDLRPPRYQVVLGSESGHCCFDATVVDTRRGEDGAERKEGKSPYLVCECFYEVDANRICDLLNAAEERA